MDSTRLKRAVYQMPEYVRAALCVAGAEAAYRKRPAYQQNDYVGWITRAKRPETRRKRIDKMLDELLSGSGYMGMAYVPRD